MSARWPSAGRISGASEAVVLGHQHPDGDSIGSVLAMAMMLEARGIRVQASWPDPFVVRQVLLPSRHRAAARLPSQARRAGRGARLRQLERLEDLKRVVDGAGVINIDHHPDNPASVTPTSSTTGPRDSRDNLHLLPATGLVVELDPARCLYTGLVTDTGRFQFTNTSPGTLLVASEMGRAGGPSVESTRTSTRATRLPTCG